MIELMKTCIDHKATGQTNTLSIYHKLHVLVVDFHWLCVTFVIIYVSSSSEAVSLVTNHCRNAVKPINWPPTDNIPLSWRCT